MSIKTFIETTLQNRAPFLSLSKFNRGFSIGIPGYPFLLKECHRFLGYTITTMTEEQFLAILDELLPSGELVKKYNTQLTELYQQELSQLNECVTKEQWQSVSEHAQTLSDIKAQLEILKKAAWFVKP